MINITSCALVRIKKIKLLSLILSSSMTAMRRRYLGFPLTTSEPLKVTLKLNAEKPPRRFVNAIKSSRSDFPRKDQFSIR